MSAYNDAVHLTPEGHADMPSYLYNLGCLFLCRFEHMNELSDIDKAISTLDDAARLIPAGHARMPPCLNSLGHAFSCRFERTGNRIDLENAIGNFRLSATSSAGAPSDRLRAALRWARLSSENDALTSLDGYGIALSLLPRVAWLGQTISTRHKELISVGGIANEAAAAAIKSRQHETALEWLEQGRSVVWGQLLNLRTPVDLLHDTDSQLADDLVHVSKALENASTRDDSLMSANKALSMEQASQRHRELAMRWDTLVEKVRTLPGFEDFLQPKKFAKLWKAARSGPVIVINVHKSRCDALIVVADLDEVIHVPLDSFSYDRAQALQHSLYKSLSVAGVRMRDGRGGRMVSTKPSDCGFEGILSNLWTFVVKPVLDALAFSVGYLF
jgi:hypothetical protein